MIYVTVGTTDWKFTRLVKAMDDYARSTDEPVVMQIGRSDYVPTHAKYFRFADNDQIDKCYSECRLIVSHAGIGSMIASCKYKKPIVIVPRKPEFNEHYDNHQLEICKQLELEHGVSIAWSEKDIEKEIKKNGNMIDFGKDNKLFVELNDYIHGLEKGTIGTA